MVFDLDGSVLQRVPVTGMPGNIDVRYRFPRGGELVDIVAFNDRDNWLIVICSIDPVTREYVRVDNGCPQLRPWIKQYPNGLPYRPGEAVAVLP